MANLTTCLQKVGAKLDPADKAAVMARSRELRTLAKERGEPMSATDAAIQAAKDVIAEIRAELKAAEPAQPAQRKSSHPKTVMGSELLALVSARLGGLDPAWLPEFSTRFATGKKTKDGTPQIQWRNPPIPGVGLLFRRGGTQDLSAIAQMLEEADYLESGSTERDYKEAGERAKDMIRAALNRDTPKTLSQQQAEMEAGQEAERKAYYDALDEESAAEADAERAAIMAEAGMSRLEIGAVDDDDLTNMAFTTDTATQMRAMGFTEQEIADELAREAQVAAAAAQASAGQDAQAGPEAAPAAGPAGVAAAQRGAEPAEGLTLEAQTPEALKAKAAREKAAADADAKEQKRLAAKAKADAEAPEFTLTGSDRPADVAAAAGQGDIFDQPAESSTRQAPVKQAATGMVPAGLNVTFGGKTYPVESIEDAQRKWIKFQESADDGGPAGVSQIGNGIPVKDGAGRLVARVAYNGRAFDPQDNLIAEAPASAPVEQDAPRFADNKVFTQSDVDAARALLKKKLGQLNSGIDPELMQAGITIAGAYIESGVRKFADFAAAMVKDLGERVKQFLKSWYAATTMDPRAVDMADGVTPLAEVQSADVDEAIKSAQMPVLSQTPQISTPAFKAWFGDSKVVDAKGAPLVVFHGAPDARFVGQDGIFKSVKERLGMLESDPERSFFFAADRGTASTYADDRRAFDYQNAEPGVVAAYLSIKNPMVINANGADWTGTRNAMAEAKAAGHDGVIIRNVRDEYNNSKNGGRKTDVFVAFNPEQIKSATRNSGAFDPANPSILLKQGPGRGVPLSTLKPHIDAIKAKMPGLRNTVEVVATVTDLPADIVSALRSMNALGTVRGLRMPDGRVFLVADKLDSRLEAEFVLFHEVYGHEGLRAILTGDEYASAMTLVRLSNKKVAAEADQWMSSYGADQIDARVQNGMTPEAARREVRLLAIEEALADRAGKNDPPSVWKNVMAAIQKALRRAGMNDLANWLENRTEAETYALLMQARKAITEGKPHALKDLPAGMVASSTAPTFYSALLQEMGKAPMKAGTGLPLFSKRPPPLAPAITVQPDANGNPEFAGDGVVLAYPQPAERFEFIPGPGQRLLNYAIMPAEGFDSMGFVELVVENGRVTSLMDIEVNGAGRRAGVGRKVIETILAANPEADVNISNIVHQARGFWAKMGVPEQNLEDGAAYDGTLNWQAYAQAANDGRAAQVGQGMRGEAGADDRGRQGADRRPASGAQAPVLSQKPAPAATGTPAPIATTAQKNLPATRAAIPASWRDPTNRLQFAPGQWLYNALGRLAAPLLVKMQFKAATPEMRRQLRQMKLDVQKAQDVAVAVAGETTKLSEAEREMVSDIIEREVAAGTVPPAHAVRLAAMMNQAMGEQSKELVRLGMLTQEAADRWDGTYLPRFYESKLKKQVGDAWADAVKRLGGRTSAMRGVKGSHLKSRGIFEPIAAKDLDQWEQMGWEIRDPDYPVGTKAADLTARMNAGLLQPDEPIQMWRDYTRAERDKMGEIRDAGFRFVMGYMQTQRDIALGRMFEKMATDPASSSRIPKEGWVQVPNTIIEGTGAKRYGKLSGRYVPKETLSHLSQIEESQSAAWQFYRQGMAIWKMGKALALDTPIPTPSGWTTMGEVGIGDVVFDEQGKPCNVTYATDVQLERECYEVEFSDGQVIVADAEHLWLTKYHGKDGIRTTAEVLATLKERTRGDNNHSVPVTGALQTPDADLPVPPYALGAWLGDGDTAGVRITSGRTHLHEIRSNLLSCGVELGDPVKDSRREVYCFVMKMVEPGRRSTLPAAMRALGVIGNKHIPAAYLRGSEGQRRSLLQGLMDTDGTIDLNGACSYCTSSEQLRDGVLELLRSLGYKPVYRVKESAIGDVRHKDAFIINFAAYADKPPFRLSLKAERLRDSPFTRQRSSTRQIVDIRPVESVPVKCIEVDSPSHLYLAGRGMIPTHNTAMNPVSHMNNVLSNLTMAQFAGVGYHRADKYVAAIKDFATAAPAIKEARDAGLFLGTMSDAELMNTLPKELQELAGKAESSTVKGAKRVFDLMTFFLRKPMGAAYQAEDTFFRYLIYKDARGRGLGPDDAIDYAQKFIFTYDDLPKGARMVRDFGIPFFAYTYKAVPALLSTALTHPVRFAAPAAVLWAANAMAYAIAAGDDDDTWPEILSKYLNDEDFRAKVREQEKLERENLPPWMKGTTALSTPKAIRLGMDEVTKLPLFIDVARIIPGGDIFDVSPNAGGIPLPQPITPSHPLFSIATGMIANKDLWTGKDLVDKNDTRIEAAEKRSEWMWKQISPAMAIGNYHWERGMNALAQASGGEIKWLPEFIAEDYTGVGRDRLPVQPGLAAMQTFGIKVRPIDIEKSIQMEGTMREKMIRDIAAEYRTLSRLNQAGVISDTRLEKERAKTEEKVQRLREGLTVDGDARP